MCSWSQTGLVYDDQMSDVFIPALNNGTGGVNYYQAMGGCHVTYNLKVMTSAEPIPIPTQSHL